MMPSRGLRYTNVHIKPYHAHTASRSFTSRIYRPRISSLGCISNNAQTLHSVQKRNISYNPLNWISSTNTVSKDISTTSSSTTPTSIPLHSQPPLVEVTSFLDPPHHHLTHDTSSPALPSTDIPVDLNAASTSIKSTTSEIIQSLSPDQIGYLNSLGLDYGYGPTSILQWLLEHIHIYSSTPWWASILLTSILYRLSLVPLTIKATDSTARLAWVRPYVQVEQNRIQQAYKNNDIKVMSEAKAEMMRLYKSTGASYKAVVANLGCNVVFGFCGFRMVRNMSALPVPGLLDGGILWFHDLAAFDPYYLMPLLSAGVMHVTARLSMVDNSPAQIPGMRNAMLYFLPGLTFVTLSWLSAGINLWIIGGGGVGLILTRLMANNTVREKLGITQMPPRGHAEQFGAAATNPWMAALANNAQGTSPQGRRDGQWKVMDVNAHSRSTTGPVYEPPKSTLTKQSNVVMNDKSNFSKFSDKAADGINSLGSSYEKMGKWWENIISKQAEAKKEKSKRANSATAKTEAFMKRAEEYEHRYQADKQRQK